MSPTCRSVCCFRVGGRRGWVPALLHLLPSPPEESCPRLPQSWLQGGSGAGLEESCRCGGHETGHPRCGCRTQARPARSLFSLDLPVAHLIVEERLCTSHLLTFLFLIAKVG